MKMLVMCTDVEKEFNLENVKLFEHSSIEIIPVDGTYDANMTAEDYIVSENHNSAVEGVIDSILTHDGIIKTKYDVAFRGNTSVFLSNVSDVKWDKDKIPLADDAVPVAYINGFIIFKQKNDAYYEKDNELYKQVFIAVHESLLEDYAYDPCIFFNEE